MAGVFALVAMTGNGSVHAQETVAYSLSQLPRPPEVRLGAERTFITLGPFRGQMSAGFGVVYDDNANLTSSGAQSEIRVSESLGLDLRWILTYINQIRFQLGATLTEVAGPSGTQALQFAIQPGSNAELRLFAGDFLIRLYDYLAVIDNPAQDPALANQSAINELTNDAGLAVDWDLSPFILTGRFDYSYSTNLSSTSSTSTSTSTSGFSSTTGDRSSIRPGFDAGYALSPQMTTGLTVQYSHSTGSTGANPTLSTAVSGPNEIDAFTIGAFLRGHLTRAISIDLSGGVYPYTNAPGATGVPFYISLNVTHQVNRFLQYTASFTRDLEFSIGSDVTKNNNFTLGARVGLSRDLSLATGGFVNFGTVVTGNFPGDYVQYGFDIGLNWALSRKITASLGYGLIVRDADQGNYRQNRVELGVNYKF